MTWKAGQRVLSTRWVFTLLSEDPRGMDALEVFFEIHTDLDRESPGRDRYTRQAFRMLPPVARPRILDVGCGPGAATMELAGLCNGEVTALDFHQPFLERLNVKIEEAGLSGRIRAVHGSMFEMDFPEGSFDIIWAEGSIYIIGFDRGLREWQRLLKPGGCLVATEVAWLRPDPPQEVRDFWEANYPSIRTIPENLEQIAGSGYRLVGHFTLPEDAWWVGYYIYLEKRLQGLREKYSVDPGALAVLDEEQREIDMYRRYSEWYGSVFFLMQKGEAKPEMAGRRLNRGTRANRYPRRCREDGCQDCGPVGPLRLCRKGP